MRKARFIIQRRPVFRADLSSSPGPLFSFLLGKTQVALHYVAIKGPCSARPTETRFPCSFPKNRKVAFSRSLGSFLALCPILYLTNLCPLRSMMAAAVAAKRRKGVRKERKREEKEKIEATPITRNRANGDRQIDRAMG